MDSKKFYSSLGLVTVAILIWSVVFGSVINIVQSVFEILCVTFNVPVLFWLAWLCEWPKALILGFLFGVVYVMCRRTTVLVMKDRILIKRAFKHWEFPECAFCDAETSKKLSVYDVFMTYFVKRYLVFNVDGKRVKYRVYDMTGTQLEKIVDAVRKQRMQKMSIEEKVEIQEDLQEDFCNEFYIGASNIYNAEKRYRLSVMKILLVCGMLLLVLGLIGTTGERLSVIPLEFTGAIVLVYVFTTPFNCMWLKAKSKKCPGYIKIGEDAIWINEERYTYSALTKIELTSPRKVTLNEALGKRYFKINVNESVKKYWMGSEASFGEYEFFCECLEKAMFAYADKIVYRE